MHADTSKNEATWHRTLEHYDAEYDTTSSLLIRRTRGGALVVFYALRDSDGNLYVRYLYFNEGHWQAGNSWLDNHWDGHNPAACPRHSLHFSPALLGRGVLFASSIV